MLTPFITGGPTWARTRDQLIMSHGEEMFKKNNILHMQAMNSMKEMMQKPNAFQDWFQQKKQYFEALPED